MEFSDSGSSGVNRRKHDRKMVRRTAQLLLPDRSVIQVRTTDVSKGGVGVISDLNLSHGTVCQVHITIPSHPQDKTVHNIQAKVVHSVYSHAENGFKVGFQFIDVSPRTEEALARYLMP